MNPNLPTGYSLTRCFISLSSTCSFQIASAAGLSSSTPVDWSRISYCGAAAKLANADISSAAASNLGVCVVGFTGWQTGLKFTDIRRVNGPDLPLKGADCAPAGPAAWRRRS